MLQPDVGGIKQYFLSLFRELLSREDSNQYVFFYFKQNAAELNKIDSELWRENAVLLHSQKEIVRYLDTIDIYFCPFGTLYPRPLPLPTVVTLVDIQEVFYPNFFTLHNLLARNYQYRGSTRMADRVVTISDFSKQSIVAHHRVPEEKVKVAYLCADERFYRAKEVARRPDRPLPEKFVFYPANHWFHKNHDILLRALVWLRDERKVLINAVFTGFDQDAGYQIKKKAREYGLQKQVFQLGYVSVEELAYLYSKAQMLVFPSLFEGFGIPLVEAMAAGCPVLAAEATSLPEVGGESVAYFDPSSAAGLGEAIVELAENENLRQDLIVQGQYRAKEFSAARMGDDHLKIFNEACDSYRRSTYLRNRWLRKYYDIGKLLSKVIGHGLWKRCKRLFGRCSDSQKRQLK
ncbi:MAG: glycosyltransferase family 4 protein [Desulfocapsa sp.]|nr:glycosyltransferase family 4 protein [Desulfocapsa sp.]